MATEQYSERSIYFFVLFADGDLRVPIIRTPRYLGTTRRSDGTNALLFEDIDRDASQRKVVFGEKDAQEVVIDGPALLERLRSSFSGSLATGTRQEP